MKKILQKEEKILRKVATEVAVADIKTPKIKKVLKEMSETLAGQHDGVAIAAPQIGYSLRIFAVSGKIFSEEFPGQGLSQRDRRENERPASRLERDPERESPRDMIFINPKIIKLSKQKEWLPEGCLSVRPIYGKTHRAKKATIVAYDEKGKKFERGASGLLAQIFQHETEHLEGILFIDHAKELEEERPEKKTDVKD